MNQETDYYKVLNLEKNASDDEIKKTYKKLALLYHPDKNKNDPESSEKFKKISEAYSILSDSEKRKNYDSFGIVDENFINTDPFSVFNEIFQQHMNGFMNMKYENDVNVGNIFSNISGFPQEAFPFGNVHVRVHTFPTDVFQMNEHENIHDNFTEKLFDDKPNLNNIFDMFKKPNKSEIKTENKKNGKPESIIYNVNASLKDIYNFKTKKITINRNRIKKGLNIEKEKTISIPLFDKELILENEGNEFKDYIEKGDIVINIYTEYKNKKFKRINDYDLLTFKNINLNQFYSAFIFDLKLPNLETIKIQPEKMNNKNILLQKIINKGIPYKNEDNEMKYGNLYILYKIEYPENFDDLKNLEKYTDNSNIDDEYFTSYNCDIEEIFNDE